ncbi:hypothetical protein RHMOL_Rhmol12G0065500 [Rhododendron molle]|uniref:Uncharacterized protein n=1 Tax=Rhododendron molle TaxID=49168 RepID=A0ACC0LEY9_RHOML|nr:hypothetical protein RHMOL_Rhmol12G0065500 [Rhododendron molle]
MGNCACIDSSAKVDTAQSLHTSSEISKNSSKTSISSGGPSLTFPSYRKSAESLPTPRSEGEILSSPNVKAFSFNELKNATRNFRPDSLLGEGGFGYVFKGWIDEHTLTAVKPGSGMVIAVKRLKPEGFQGHKEWLASFRDLLEFKCRGAEPLPWATRIKVAIGAARGLSFLHDAEVQVIYRDFKASNILLDSDFNAKLSDFGLAKAGPTGDRTHVSTQVVGTHGYAAPEYVATGRLTTKSDVYSFGVVLLELLTGRSAVDKSKLGVEQNLVDWAKPYLGDKRKVFRIMDTKLAGQYPQKAAYTASTLALQCLCVEPRLRPRIIDVLEMLEQVQAPKTASKNSISDHQTVSDSNRKLPSRSQRSSTDRKPTAASLPPHRQSSG